MNDKEQLFCDYYLLTGNPREAAARAGYRLMPERWGMKLLSRTSVKEYLESQSNRPARNGLGMYGLERLAFGSIADAVQLMLCETPPTKGELEGMDLFMISEIKKPKGGGMEIKFFDRLKALELLCQAKGTPDEDKALPFYQALQMGAMGLKGADRE